MLFWIVLAALFALFILVPAFTPYPAGSDSEHVVEHRAGADSALSVAQSMWGSAVLVLFFFDMALSRGATAADPARARVARARATAILNHITTLEQAGNLAQYGVANAAKGSVAGAVAAGTGSIIGQITDAIAWLLSKLTSVADVTAALSSGLQNVGAGLSAGVQGVVARVADLEASTSSADAQDFCARVAQVMGIGLVSLLGTGLSCESFYVLPSLMRFAAVIVAVTFLALTYFSNPGEKWGAVFAGTVSSIKTHTASNSAALAVTLAVRVLVCSIGGGS